MEKFKAVEKAMKTKAYSKEGLSAAAKLDPKEQAKVDCIEFLSNSVDELEQQIEALEAESEQISATMKKGKSQQAKAERIAEIEEFIEKHKWHQGKLELIRRSLENGGVETDQVMELEENIKYYLTDGMNEDYMDDEEMYDELELEDEEGAYGINVDTEKGSSQDNQSVQEEPTPEPVELPKPKKSQKEPETAALRRPSAQTKSPLPALATLHTPLPTISNGNNSGPTMKPAQVPSRPAGEGLKYASAAAAAAASDKASVGISPLPPPPGSQASGISPLPPIQQSRSSATSSPATTAAQPAISQPSESKQSAPSEPDLPAPAPRSKKSKAAGKQPAAPESSEASKGKLSQTNNAFLLPSPGSLIIFLQHLIPMESRTVSSPSKRSQRRNRFTTCHQHCTIW